MSWWKARSTNAQAPKRIRAADRTAIHGQRQAVRLNAWKLVLLVVGALCGTTSWVSSGSDVDLVALAAAMAFGTSLTIEVRQLSQRPDHRWYKARAGAESVKTLAWKYAVGGEPFGINQSVVDDDFLGR